jgi:hypothetical protein
MVIFDVVSGCPLREFLFFLVFFFETFVGVSILWPSIRPSSRPSFPPSLPSSLKGKCRIVAGIKTFSSSVPVRVVLLLLGRI